MSVFVTRGGYLLGRLGVIWEAKPSRGQISFRCLLSGNDNLCLRINNIYIYISTYEVINFDKAVYIMDYLTCLILGFLNCYYIFPWNLTWKVGNIYIYIYITQKMKKYDTVRSFSHLNFR